MLLPEKERNANRLAAVTDSGASLTYGELVQFSELIQKQIPHRSLVFSLSQNTIGSLCGYVSFLSNRIVPLLLDGHIKSSFLHKLIELYEPEFLWLPDNRRSEFEDCTEVFAAHDYSLVKRNIKRSFSLHPDLALLLTTSGTTGSPKIVRISYENLEANADSIAEYLSIDEQERPITALPMVYSYGLSVINSHLRKGTTILLTSKSIVEKEFWTFLKTQKASSLSGVAASFEMLDKLGFFRMDLPYLKTITQAGSKLNPELHKKFAQYAQDKGKRFFVMYGQTEATARISYLPAGSSLEKAGSIGIAIPGGELKLVDETGFTIQEANRTGELVYTGKNVSMGYAFSGEDLNKGDENKGILFTGDLARKDEEGFYFITGRKNRFIKIFGNRISLDEMENLLVSIAPDCICTGEDDMLIVYTNDQSKLAKIRNYITEKTGIHHSAFSVQHREFISEPASGKSVFPFER